MKLPSLFQNIIHRGLAYLQQVPFLQPYVAHVLGDKDITELVKGSGIAFVFKFLSLPLGFATSLIISRWYGAEAMGLYGLTTTVMGILISIGLMGLGGAMPRFLGEAKAKGKGKSGSIYMTSRNIVLLSGCVLSICLYLGSEYIGVHIFSSEDLILPLQIGSFFLIPLIIRGLNESFLIAGKEIYHAELINKLLVPCSLIVFLLWFYWIGIGKIGPIWGFFLSGFIGTGLSQFFTQKKISLQEKIPVSRKELLHISKPILITSMSFFIVTNTDIIMLGILQSASDVGVYKVVTLIASFVSIIMGILALVLGPQISQLLREEKKETIQNLLTLSNKISTFIAVFLGVLLLVFSRQVLGFFGEEFIMGKQALFILIIYQIINVITGYGGLVLNYGGTEKIYKNILLGSAIGNIIINYLLIPQYGVVGAAFSTAVSFNFANILVLYYTKKKFNLNPAFTFSTKNVK